MYSCIFATLLTINSFHPLVYPPVSREAALGYETFFTHITFELVLPGMYLAVVFQFGVPSESIFSVLTLGVGKAKR